MYSPPKPINHTTTTTTTTFFAESNRIVTANNAHFLTLSFLSFFPLFISLLTFLHVIISQSNSNPIYLNYATITLSLLYALFVLSLYIAGVATITHSTQQGLYGTPLNLSSIFDSITKSFFPLGSTTLASGACLLLAFISFLFFSASFLSALKVLGFNINFSSTIFIRFRIVLFLVSFHVHLTLAAIISVVESKWGFEPLRRSFFIVRGMKRSSLTMLLLCGISIWVIMLGFSTQIFTTGGSWNYYLEILQILNISMFWTIFMSSLVIQYTVLYLYCKDYHEESGFDIATEISKECVSLAIDDRKLVRESNVKFLVFAVVVCAAMFVVLKLQII